MVSGLPRFDFGPTWAMFTMKERIDGKEIQLTENGTDLVKYNIITPMPFCYST